MLRTSIQHVGTATTTSARPKPQRLRKADALLAIGNGLAHEILSGDPEVGRALSQKLRDLGGGDEIHLHVGQFGNLTLVAACRARLADGQPCARQRLGALLHQPPLGGQRQDKLLAHMGPLQHGQQALGVNAGTHGGHLDRGADLRQQAIIAPTAGEWALGPEFRHHDLEHETGVVFEIAAKLGGELRRIGDDAGGVEIVEPALEGPQRLG